MNKLIVLKLKSNNEVIAITEYKYHMKLFILQNEFTQDEYTIKEYTNKNKINKYLIKYSDHYYLIEYKDFIIRNSDKKYIEEMVYKTIKEIKNTINNLESINSNCILSPKEHRKITDSINILTDKLHKKNIDEFINIHYLIKNFCSENNIKSNLQELDNMYYFNLFKGE